MSQQHIADTGALVAFLSVRDHHHGWAKHSFSSVRPPVFTCEAVLAEAWHLLRGTEKGQLALLELMTTGVLVCGFELQAEATAVRRLVARYRDRPMSLADACLVRMAELYDAAAVLTTDRDFLVYRKHGRQAIAIVAPFA